jgi:hypothetical protein
MDPTAADNPLFADHVDSAPIWVAENGRKWPKMAENGRKWPKMAKNG